jgi:hypothetical protein
MLSRLFSLAAPERFPAILPPLMRALLLPLAFALPVACTQLPPILEPTVDGGASDASLDATADSALTDGGAPDSAVPDAGPPDGGDADAATDSGPRDAGPIVDGLRAGCAGSRGVLSLPQVAVTATSVYWVGPSCGAGPNTAVLHQTGRARVASGAPLCGQGAEFVLPAADPAFLLRTAEGVAVVTHGRFVLRLNETSGLTSSKTFGAGLSASNIAAAALAATAGKPMTIAWISSFGSPFFESNGSTVIAGSGGQNRGVAVTDQPLAYFAQIRNNVLYIDEKPGLGSPATSVNLTPVDQIHIAGDALLVRQGTQLSSNVGGTMLAPLAGIASDGFVPTFGSLNGDVVNVVRGASDFTVARVARSGGSWVSKELGTASPFTGIASADGGATIDVATTGPCSMGDSFINFERFAK